MTTLDPDQSARLNRALCELVGIDPDQTTNITAEVAAGDQLATIRWEGVARIDPATLIATINNLQL